MGWFNNSPTAIVVYSTTHVVIRRISIYHLVTSAAQSRKTRAMKMRRDARIIIQWTKNRRFYCQSQYSYITVRLNTINSIQNRENVSQDVSIRLWRSALWLNDTSRLQQKCLNKWIGSHLRLTTFNPYTDSIHSNSSPLEPHTSVPSGEYIKTYCEQANRQNFHVWNSHREQAARLFETTPYDRNFLSNSWVSCCNADNIEPITRIQTDLCMVAASAAKWLLNVVSCTADLPP